MRRHWGGWRQAPLLRQDDAEGSFWLERSGQNLFLRMHDLNQDLTLVPGSDTSAFIRLTPQNPEHQSFLLKAASPEACAGR